MTLKIHSMYIVDFNSRFVVVVFLKLWEVAKKMCWKNVLTLWVGCLWFPSIRKALPAEDREEKITSEQYTCPMWISASYTCPIWIYSASADVCTVSQNLSNKSIKELYPREQHHLLVLNCFDAILMHFPTSVKPDAGTRTIWQCWLN